MVRLETKGSRWCQAGTPALRLVVSENGSDISTEVGSAPESPGWAGMSLALDTTVTLTAKILKCHFFKEILT